MWSPSRSSAVDPLLKIYGSRANWGVENKFLFAFLSGNVRGCIQGGEHRSTIAYEVLPP